MAINATSTGEICPSEIRFISRATLEKRVRRTLAAKGHRLLKSRPGTAAFREYGLYAVENGIRRIIATHQAIDSLARELGVMTEQEYIDPLSDWRYYVAKHITRTVDGKTIHSFDRISQKFRTKEEAEQHAGRLNIDTPIGIVGFAGDRS